jgi:membrane protease YdiL (CAAX protease family)
MNPSQKYRIQHLLFILFSITGLIVGLLKLQSLGYLDSFPINGFYKILIIYLVMITTTAYVYKTRLLFAIHYQIGFRKTKIKYLIIAIVTTLFIWSLDYLFQKHFFPGLANQEALDWYNNNKDVSLFLSFLSVAVIVPIVEEMLFRGVLLKTVNHYMSKVMSVLMVSLLFVVVHYSFTQSITLLFAAILYGVLAIQSKSIYPSICAHILNNSLTFIYYLGLV